MSEYTTIPKMLQPRNIIEYTQKVPKIIWQTMKTNHVPVFIKTYADSWIKLNPEYEYRFFDDDDIMNFLKTDFPNYLEGYQKLKYGASKADLWRYLIMYKYGGVYADIDSKCIRPLRDWIEAESTFVTQLGTNKDICQWLIISIPKNPIFLKAAQRTLQNSNNNNCKAIYHGFEFVKNRLALRENVPPIKFNHEVLGLSGPPVLQQAAEECFTEGLLSSILPFTQIVCISGDLSCEMKGNVRHDTGNEDYKKAYKKLQLNHYNDRLERIKRKIVRMFN
jgi:hypothetical protein